MVHIRQRRQAENAETIPAVHLARPAHTVNVVDVEKTAFVFHCELDGIWVYRVQRDVRLNGDMRTNRLPETKQCYQDSEERPEHLRVRKGMRQRL